MKLEAGDGVECLCATLLISSTRLSLDWLLAYTTTTVAVWNMLGTIITKTSGTKAAE
jgi:hypothetical protein